jgi:hypothetical protein
LLPRKTHVPRQRLQNERENTSPVKQKSKKMKTIESIRDLGTDKLLSLVKSTSTKATSANLELGKILFALDGVREGKGTLKKFVRENTGISVPDHAFCCQVAFRGLVEPGNIQESTYDGTPLKWLLQVSAIVNLLEKSSMADPDKSEIIARVAAILSDAPEGAESQLKAIKAELKPVGNKGKNSTEETGTEKVTEFSADLLSKAHLAAVGKAASEVTDPQTLRFLFNAFECLVEIAKGQLETTAPMTAAA